jgi:hypothetical protein
MLLPGFIRYPTDITPHRSKDLINTSSSAAINIDMNEFRKHNNTTINLGIFRDENYFVIIPDLFSAAHEIQFGDKNKNTFVSGTDEHKVRSIYFTGYDFY